MARKFNGTGNWFQNGPPQPPTTGGVTFLISFRCKGTGSGTSQMLHDCNTGYAQITVHNTTNDLQISIHVGAIYASGCRVIGGELGGAGRRVAINIPFITSSCGYQAWLDGQNIRIAKSGTTLSWGSLIRFGVDNSSGTLWFNGELQEWAQFQPMLRPEQVLAWMRGAPFFKLGTGHSLNPRMWINFGTPRANDGSQFGDKNLANPTGNLNEASVMAMGAITPHFLPYNWKAGLPLQGLQNGLQVAGGWFSRIALGGQPGAQVL